MNNKAAVDSIPTTNDQSTDNNLLAQAKMLSES